MFYLLGGVLNKKSKHIKGGEFNTSRVVSAAEGNRACALVAIAHEEILVVVDQFLGLGKVPVVVVLLFWGGGG